jgi:hypothetical protein
VQDAFTGQVLSDEDRRTAQIVNVEQIHCYDMGKLVLDEEAANNWQK